MGLYCKFARGTVTPVQKNPLILSLNQIARQIQDTTRNNLFQILSANIWQCLETNLVEEVQGNCGVSLSFAGSLVPVPSACASAAAQLSCQSTRAFSWGAPLCRWCQTRWSQTRSWCWRRGWFLCPRQRRQAAVPQNPAWGSWRCKCSVGRGEQERALPGLKARTRTRRKVS